MKILQPNSLLDLIENFVHIRVDTEKEYARLVTFDPEIKDAKEAKKEVKLLLEELEALRS